MRDWALLAMMAAALPYSVMHAWIGVLLWNWISLMVPQRLAFGFMFNAPVAAIAAGATLVALFVTRDRIKLPWNAPVILLVLLVLWMCFTTVFAIFPLESVDQLVKVLKIQLMTCAALAALHSRKHLELFIWVNVISVGFYGFKGGVFTIQTAGGSRVWGPPGGFIEDNNALAVALIMTIPLMHYLRAVATRRSVRVGLLLLMALCAISALGSQSRGALLAITAMVIFLWLRLKKKIVAAFVIACTAVGLLAFMPDTWYERMSTIQTYEDDRSASERLDAWEMTFRLANDRPWGGGFEIYNRTVYEHYLPGIRLPQAAHSIYFSMLGEHGYVGLVLFALLFITTFHMAGRLRRDALQDREAAWVHLLASMCQVSIVAYAVGGAFLSLAYYDFAYNLVVMIVVADRWLAERGWVTETTGPFGSTYPGAYVAAKAALTPAKPQ